MPPRPNPNPPKGKGPKKNNNRNNNRGKIIAGLAGAAGVSALISSGKAARRGAQFARFEHRAAPNYKPRVGDIAKFSKINLSPAEKTALQKYVTSGKKGQMDIKELNRLADARDFQKYSKQKSEIPKGISKPPRTGPGSGGGGLGSRWSRLTGGAWRGSK